MDYNIWAIEKIVIGDSDYTRHRKVTFFVQRTIGLWLMVWRSMYYVYVLRSLKNGKSYVGFTAKEVSERLLEHNRGASRWTSGNKPFELIYYESYYCEKDARHRELFLKSGQGKKLVSLIKTNY